MGFVGGLGLWFVKAGLGFKASASGVGVQGLVSSELRRPLLIEPGTLRWV